MSPVDDRRKEINRNLERAIEFDPDSKQTLLLAAAALELKAECRKAQPYAPMTLIFGPEGPRWTCSHDPEHSFDAKLA